MNIRIYRFIPRTRVLGKGIRSALWVQGCERRCPGCISEEMRSLDGGTLEDTGRLAGLIAAEQDTEGLTISGGEPFLQAAALCELIGEVKKRRPDYGYAVYTGFRAEELYALGGAAQRLLGFTDVLIDGEYRAELDDGKGLRGSSNQRILFLTDRYAEYEGYLVPSARKNEIFINGADVYMVGLPSKSTAALIRGFEKI